MGEQQYEQSKSARTAESAPHSADAPKASAQPRIAASSHEDFGDMIVGETAFKSIHVFNQDRDLAFLEARIEGTTAFQIVSKPTHINPSTNGFDPTAAIRVAYSSNTRKVDRGFLVATLTWRDGTSESVRVGLQGSAHRSNELTHQDEQAQNAAKQAQQQEAQDRQRADAEEERRIQAEEAKGGSYDRRIDNAAETLASTLENIFAKQDVGVTVAAKTAATYKRRLPPPPPPDIIKELAFFALDFASGKLASLVKIGLNAAGGGWAKGTPGEEGWGWSTPGKPGSKEVSISPMDPIFGFVIGKLLETGTAAIKGAAGTAPAPTAPEKTTAENTGEQTEYFAVQAEAVANKKLATDVNALQLKRSLIRFDNPRDAGKAAQFLRNAADAMSQQYENARSVQAAESMNGWIRHLSHSSLGSVHAEDAAKKGLKPTKDGSASANIENAHASKVYDGVIELEFSADANNAGRTVTATSARLYGVAAAAAASLALDKKALRTARLPIRARSTAASSPVHVTIVRDEAGNVRFSDESGAAGMSGHWLSRRGGHAGSESAAQRAAKNLIEELAGKTLTQLGVTLETDGSNE